MKFEITMSKKTFQRIKDALELQDFTAKTDAEVIKELFVVEDRFDYVCLQDKVKVKKVED